MLCYVADKKPRKKATLLLKSMQLLNVLRDPTRSIANPTRINQSSLCFFIIINSSSNQTWQKHNIYVLQFSGRKTAAIIHMYKEMNKDPCDLSS